MRAALSWGRGYATRAHAEFVAEVRERPLHARVAEHNVGSIRVLAKCGFSIVGFARAEKRGGKPRVGAKLVDSIATSLGWNSESVELAALPEHPGGTRAWTMKNRNAGSHGGLLLVRSGRADRQRLAAQARRLNRLVTESGLEAETVIVAIGPGHVEYGRRAELLLVEQLLDTRQLRWLAVDDLTCIARDGDVAHECFDRMRRAGARLHVAAFGRALDWQADRMLLQAALMFSQGEAQRLSERMLRGRQRRRV